MKIKRKVGMTLEEYAKYMIDKHGVYGYESELIDENIIGGPVRFAQTIELNPVSEKDLPNKVYQCGTMTVETEEEITEDTVFKSMVEVTTDGLLDVWGNANISAWKDVHSKEFHAYIDGEFKCIWRNGKLVE